jgi:hypothetical protein
MRYSVYGGQVDDEALRCQRRMEEIAAEQLEQLGPEIALLIRDAAIAQELFGVEELDGGESLPGRARWR